MWAIFSMFIYGMNLILCLWKPRFCFVEIWIIYVSQLHRWQSDVADLLDAKPSFFLLTISYRRWLSEFVWFVKLLEDPFKGQAPLPHSGQLYVSGMIGHTVYTLFKRMIPFPPNSGLKCEYMAAFKFISTLKQAAIAVFIFMPWGKYLPNNAAFVY